MDHLDEQLKQIKVFHLQLDNMDHLDEQLKRRSYKVLTIEKNL